LHYYEDYEEKLKQLLEVSNPKEVVMKAIEFILYFGARNAAAPARNAAHCAAILRISSFQ
jgi:hypothetical protein